MSSTNPYYRSAPDSDEDFAQQISGQSHIPQNTCRSQYNNKQDIDHKKPYFTQSDYHSTPIRIPPPSVPQKPTNIFTQMIEKYKAKRRATDLTQMSYCPHCTQMSQSFIIKKNSFIVWIICIVLLVATYVLFFLPFLFDALKNKHVVCKNCGKTKFIVKVW